MRPRTRALLALAIGFALVLVPLAGAADTTITGGPTGVVASTSATFTFTSDPGATFECAIDDPSFTGCDSPKTYTGLSQGSHVFHVRAVVDDVTGPAASRTWTVDTVAPDTTIDSGPSGTVNSTTATFTFSAETGATFQCSLDGADFTVCPASQTYTGLVDGAHTFQVRAVDAVGNTDETPASRTWTVDATGPTVTITGGPAEGSTSNSTSASFTFAAEAGATFQCQIDGGAFSPCTSPKGYTLADGSHTFAVRATDAVGNVGAAASRTWAIDTVAPDTTIDSGPSGTVGAGAAATFTFSAGEAGSFECKLDAAPFAACASPRSFSGLAGGSHTFLVRATDLAGNTDATPASRTWTIDVTPPVTTLASSGPTGTVRSTSATFTFSSEAGATFQCSLDGAGFDACSSPHSYTGLADGGHTFHVRAVDAVGNVDPTPASRTWTVDSVPPTVVITDGPASGSVTNDTTPSFAFTSEAGATFQCRLDGGAFSACTSPQSYTLVGGDHAFAVRASDAAGNVGPAESRTWTIDTTPPDTTIGTAPTGTLASARATITFSASEAATYECKLDAEAFAACTSPTSVTELADGAHTFQVRSVDAAGNTDATPATASWTVDTTPPVLDLPASKVGEANGPSGSVVTYDVTATDDGVPLLPAAIVCTPPSGATFPLGRTTVSCAAADAVANTTRGTFSVTIQDTTPPLINAPDVSFAATSVDGILRTDAAAAAYFQGVTAGDSVSRVTLTNDAPDRFPVGQTRVVFTATDESGNTATKTVTVTVVAPGTPVPKPDLTPPAKVSGAAAKGGDRQVTLTWTNPRADFAYVVVTQSIADRPGSSKQAYRGTGKTYTAKGLQNDVEYRFVIVTYDRAGNRSPDVVVAATPRALLLSKPVSGAKVTRPPLLRWAPVSRATYFNVQLWRGSLKVLSVWPTTPRYQLRRSWLFESKVRRLSPGTYRWYVWPGLGARAEARYGPMLGKSTFVVRASTAER